MAYKAVWRSWFWNVCLFICMALFAGISTAVMVAQFRMAGAGAAAVGVGFGLQAAAFWFGTVRSLMFGVYLRADEIVVRGLGRTTRIRWEDIVGVESAGMAPVVVWRRAEDAKTRTTEMRALAGYGVVWRAGDLTLEERALAAINARLSQWRTDGPARLPERELPTAGRGQ